MTNHCVSRIEALESRIAPAAAIVTVAFTAGVLSLTSDAGAHDVSITALDASTVELTASAGTLFQQGTDPETDTLRLTGAIKSLTTTLGSGADSLILVGLNVGGDLTIDLGDGANSLYAFGLDVKGSLKVTGGSDDDTVSLQSGNVVVGKDAQFLLAGGANAFQENARLLKIGGDFTYAGLAGEEQILLGPGNVLIGGNATFTLGGGTATATIGSSSFSVGKTLLFDSTASVAGDAVSLRLAPVSLTVGKDLLYKGGAGDDTFNGEIVGGAKVGGIIQLVSGAGAAAINLSFLQVAAKSIEIDASASLGLSNGSVLGVFFGSVPGGVKITGGAGTNEFDLSAGSALLGPVVFEFGNGDTSLLTVNGGKSKSFKATLGSGADSVNLNSMNVSGDIAIDVGDGSNTLNIDGLNAKGGLNVTGGSEEDHVALLGGSVLIGGNATFTFGAGAATATIDPALFTVGKTLLFDSIASVMGDAVSLRLAPTSLTVGKDLLYKGGAGDDTFDGFIVGGAKVGGAIQLVSGPGAATFGLFAPQVAAKRIEIDAGASSALSTGTGFGIGAGRVPGGVKITGGAGTDAIAFDASGCDLGPLVVDLRDGANNSLISVSRGKTKSISVSGGTGSDTQVFFLNNANVGGVGVHNGDGAASTTLNANISTTIGGVVRVESGAHPGDLAALSFGGSNAKIGGIDFITGSGPSTLDFRASGTLSVNLTIKGSIHVAGGTGDDLVDLSAMNLTVGKGIDLALGDGANSAFGFLLGLATSGLKVTSGAGSDSVLFNALGSLGAVVLDLGAGSNSASIRAFIPTFTDPLTAKSLSFTSASGPVETDNFDLAGVQVLGKLNATFGAGVSTLTIDDSLVGGLFTVDTGAGADIVNLDTGATGFGVVLAKAATLQLGDGEDLLVLGGNGLSSLLMAKAAFTADGGIGTNTLTNAAGNVFAQLPVFTNFA